MTRSPRKFNRAATGFVTPAGKHRITGTFSSDQVEKINAFAAARNMSVGTAIGRLVYEALANTRPGLLVRLTGEEIELLETHRRLFGVGGGIEPSSARAVRDDSRDDS